MKSCHFKVLATRNRCMWEKTCGAQVTDRYKDTQNIKTESIRKLRNHFNFQWTKTLYQSDLNNITFFFTFLRAIDVIIIVIRNNTKENF